MFAVDIDKNLITVEMYYFIIFLMGAVKVKDINGTGILFKSQLLQYVPDTTYLRFAAVSGYPLFLKMQYSIYLEMKSTC